jgi:hypothetical protein
MVVVAVVAVVLVVLVVVAAVAVCYHSNYTKQNSDCLQVQVPQAE